MSSRFGTKWGRIATATLLAALLLVPQAAYALPASGGGAGSGTSVDGGLISDDGVTILVPYIPPIPTITIDAGAAYQLALIQPVPQPWTDYCIGIPNVADFCLPIPDVSNLVPWVEDTVANGFISGFNAISRDGSKALDQVWNLLIGALNLPVDLFDGFTTGFGALLLGGVLSVGEPWSVVLVPVIWGVVAVVLVLMLVFMVWGVKTLIKALKGTEEAVALVA